MANFDSRAYPPEVVRTSSSDVHSSTSKLDSPRRRLSDDSTGAIITDTNGKPLDGKPLDDLIAQDFTNLSFQDRNALNEEIHGVQCLAPEETPNMVADAIQRMSQELDNIKYKPAYVRSQQWNSLSSSPGIDCTQSVYSYNKRTIAAGTHSTYVNTLDFRLRFLRAELFDAKKAAIRMVKFLEIVMELYDGNEELLRRPIGLVDLKSKEEKNYIKLGNHQLLPFRDRSGRRVIAMVPDMERIPSVRMRVSSDLSIFQYAGRR